MSEIKDTEDGYRFFHITYNGQNLGIFAGTSPADAVLEMSWDADPGAPHDFIVREINRNKFSCDKITYGGRQLPDKEILAVAEKFISLKGVIIEDLSSASINKLNHLARTKCCTDWKDFLLTRLTWRQFTPSRILAERLLYEIDPLWRFDSSISNIE